MFAKKANIFPLAKIIFKNGGMTGREFFIYNINPPDNPAGFVKIGRKDPQGEQFFIPVASQTVSREHAKVVSEESKLSAKGYKAFPSKRGKSEKMFALSRSQIQTKESSSGKMSPSKPAFSWDQAEGGARNRRVPKSGGINWSRSVLNLISAASNTNWADYVPIPR